MINLGLLEGQSISGNRNEKIISGAYNPNNNQLKSKLKKCRQNLSKKNNPIKKNIPNAM